MDHSALSWDSFFTELDDKYGHRVRKADSKSCATANHRSTKPKQCQSGQRDVKSRDQRTVANENSFSTNSAKTTIKRGGSTDHFTDSAKRSGMGKIATTSATEAVQQQSGPRNNKVNHKRTASKDNAISTRRATPWADEITITKDGYIFMSSPQAKCLSTDSIWQSGSEWEYVCNKWVRKPSCSADQKKRSLINGRGVPPTVSTARSTGVLSNMTNQHKDHRPSASKRAYDSQWVCVGGPNKKQKVG